MYVNRVPGKTFQADQVRVEQVIICTKARRGDGNSSSNPIRVITEIFSLQGEKIAEYDPQACDICGQLNCSSDHK